MGARTPRQILIGAIVALASIECLGWALGTIGSWRFRTLAVFEPLTPDQLSENTEFAILLSVVLVINVAGILAFIFRRDSYGLPTLAVIQAADIAVTVVTFVWRSSEPLLGSLEFSVPPAGILVLLAMLRRSVPRHA
jgi:hypothetical protein